MYKSSSGLVSFLYIYLLLTAGFLHIACHITMGQCLKNVEQTNKKGLQMGFANWSIRYRNSLQCGLSSAKYTSRSLIPSMKTNLFAQYSYDVLLCQIDARCRQDVCIAGHVEMLCESYLWNGVGLDFFIPGPSQFPKSNSWKKSTYLDSFCSV